MTTTGYAAALLACFALNLVIAVALLSGTAALYSVALSATAVICGLGLLRQRTRA